MEYKLEDLIDIPLFQSLQEKLYLISPFSTAIIDNEGKILTAVEWQELCTNFYRKHPVCEKECIKSDQYILEHLHEAKPAVSYLCPHGLIDNATPIIIEGKHLANFFIGQFFLEKPNLDAYRQQAQKYSFDEKLFLEAVEKVPVWTKKQLLERLAFVKDFIEILATTGLKRLKEFEVKNVLQESEEKFRLLTEKSVTGIYIIQDGKMAYVNPSFAKAFGYSSDEIIDKIRMSDLIHPDDLQLVQKRAKERLAGKIEAEPLQYKALKKDGSSFYIEVYGMPINYQGQHAVMGTMIDVTERRHAREELIKAKERAEKNQAVNESRVHLLQYIVGHSLYELLEETLNESEKLTGSSIGFYHFVNDDQLTLSLQNWSTGTKSHFCEAKGEGLHYPIADAGVWVDCVYQRKPVIHNNYASLQHRKGLPEGHAMVVRELVVPVMRGEKVKAILGIGNKESDYTQEDVENVSLLANLAWEIAERKMAEDQVLIAKEKAVESETRLKLAIDSGKLGIWDWDVQENSMIWNERMFELYGIKDSSFTNTVDSWLNGLHPEDKERAIEELNMALYNHKEFDTQFRVVHSDKTVLHIKANGIVIRDNNKPIRMIGINRDVTETILAQQNLIQYKDKLEQMVEERTIELTAEIKLRKEAENALLESKELLNLAFHYSNDWELYRDKNLKPIYCSQSIEKIVGYTPEDYLSGKVKLLDILHPDDVEKVSPIHTKMLNGEVVESLIVRYIHKDGHIVWVDISGRPVYAGNEIIGMRFSAKNITDLIMVQQKLAESETQYRNLVDYSTSIVLEWDPDGNILFMNKYGLDFLGFSLDELVGKNVVGTIVEPLDSKGENLEEKMKIVQKQPEKFYSSENENIKKNREKVWIAWTNKGTYNSDGILVKTLSVGIDRTRQHELEIAMQQYKNELEKIVEDRTAELMDVNKDLVKAKEKAEESDQLKTAFLHNISHEIRTPLNAIMGFSELLAESDYDPAKKRKMTDTILSSGIQLMNIVDDILAISRIEVGLETKVNEKVNINVLGQDLYSQFQTKAMHHNVDFAFKPALTEKEAYITTDKTKLIQTLTNLISNAFKFTQQGYVEFGYMIEPENVVFYVKDTGIGIPPNMLDEIFNRFRQVEITDNRRYGGSGLGLSISKAYVELLGGSIWVTSMPGQGSTFYFTIPVQQESILPGVSENSKSNAEIILPKGLNILIVEDEESNYMLLEEMLSEFEPNIVWAKNGLEAVDICKKQPKIQLILMDLKMPVLDGFEATKLIREMYPTMPILAQSAYSSTEDITKALDAGCNDLLSKPVKLKSLLLKLSQLLIA